MCNLRLLRQRPTSWLIVCLIVYDKPLPIQKKSPMSLSFFSDRPPAGSIHATQARVSFNYRPLCSFFIKACGGATMKCSMSKMHKAPVTVLQAMQKSKMPFHSWHNFLLSVGDLLHINEYICFKHVLN